MGVLRAADAELALLARRTTDRSEIRVFFMAPPR